MSSSVIWERGIPEYLYGILFTGCDGKTQLLWVASFPGLGPGLSNGRMWAEKQHSFIICFLSFGAVCQAAPSSCCHGFPTPVDDALKLLWPEYFITAIENRNEDNIYNILWLASDRWRSLWSRYLYSNNVSSHFLAMPTSSATVQFQHGPNLHLSYCEMEWRSSLSL